MQKVMKVMKRTLTIAPLASFFALLSTWVCSCGVTSVQQAGGDEVPTCLHNSYLGGTSLACYNNWRDIESRQLEFRNFGDQTQVAPQTGTHTHTRHLRFLIMSSSHSYSVWNQSWRILGSRPPDIVSSFLALSHISAWYCPKYPQNQGSTSVIFFSKQENI